MSGDYMTRLWKDLKWFLDKKVYWILLSLTAVCGYGFSIVQPSIGIDDTAVALYLYEMGIFFTTFVMMQFWNIFNAKNYRTEGSFFLTMFSKNSFSGAFYLIVLVILGGQYLIVNCLGNFFDVAPLTAGDWWRIIAVTSLVLVVPEIKRILKTIFVKK